MHWIKQTYLPIRFYLLFGALAVLMAFGFVFSPLIQVTFVLLAAALALVILDFVFLYEKKNPLEVTRRIADVLSLGDNNNVQIRLSSKHKAIKSYTLIDELPYQLQVRDFEMKGDFSEEEIVLNYAIKPLKRGQYAFGKINVFVNTSLGLITRKVEVDAEKISKVFPSVVQLKKYEIIALSSANPTFGLKNIRRIGHSYEFDQIKNYVFGDDSRSINWKASGRKGALMVNQFEDERSQQIVCLIDNSRLMQKPFKGMAIHDYAVNSTLALSNIILKKHDKAGLITFSKKINSFLLPNNNTNQLNKIYHALYNEQTSMYEANYEQLHYAVKTTLTNRSLLFLFTNFDTPEDLKDVLPILRKLNRNHLLVVVFFEDTELLDLAQESCKDVFDVYEQTIMRKLINEKEQIVRELRKHGIQTFKTTPEHLSMQTIQKYFELKSRGLI